MDLSGKTALITGAAKRIGRAIAERLAREGVHLVLHHRASENEASALCAEAQRVGVRAWTVQADLADEREAAALLPRAIEMAGAIDFLVNNASIFPTGVLGDVTTEALKRCLDVNAVAPLILSRAFAAQGREGCIVNLLDTRFAGHDPEHAAYHLSKRMLFDLTRMTARDFAPRVRVNAIAPGLILPPEGKDMEYLVSLHGSNPLNSHGAPEDVTEAVVFLLRSDFVTGQVIFVDGGRHMRESMYGY
jgi:pteridine reductase